ncbi:core-2/I-Branching enzyme [Paracoccus versutus]|uniref:Peptide O-xylosyltransferase n=2 Tax=Paracoccaceae TaxID=31989 RepID=A0A3D9XQP7_PARVE|nr:core-2/I-Branching enzyme [Paracoccus versutus]REG55717.1 core-2/I-Branching enzyme [Paracoccus versutus]
MGNEMARIAFILLCHKDPEGVVAQARRLTASGDYVAIHFDGRANPRDYELIRAALADNASVVFAQRRWKCGWGEWSLVGATLEAVRAAVAAFPRATHFYMLSGDCMPIKSAEYAHGLLDGEDCDYIESFDFFESDWIKTGFKEERLVYRHWFNERTQKWLFYASYDLQKRFGLRRRVPADIQVMIGSQWWCLRRLTVEKVLDFCASRPDVMRFFSTTWIPDETFFQTVVPHVVPRREIRTRTLTYLIFTDYGMPVTFYNDHYDLLMGQNYLFARKISPEAIRLRERLGALWAASGVHFPISNEATGLFRFLTGRGRVGRRFGQRFWEAEGSLGRDNTLLLVVAKKWHVAKRLTAAIRAHTPIPAVDYLFNEPEAHLPDLGGVETTVEKRDRHRRALIRLLFQHFESNRLVLCLDPSALYLIQDLTSDKADTRVLLVDSEFDDDYLRGHIARVGLAGSETAPEVIERLLPMVRADLEHEAERLRDMDFPGFHSIAPWRPVAENTAQLARFLDLPAETALALARTDHLFSD